MTEHEIIILNFEKNVCDDGSHYYTHDIVQGLSLISSCSDEAAESNDDWYIDVFNTEIPVRFYKMVEVQALINMLDKHVVKT